MNEKFRHLILGAWLAVALAACGGTMEDKLGGALAAPDKYVLYSCTQLAAAAAGNTARQKQLEALMAKAGPGADGRVVSALAYQPEYLQLHGDMNQLRRYQAEKDCKAPPAAVPPAPAAATPAPAAAKPAKPGSDGKAR
jgi:hypothetical protein